MSDNSPAREPLLPSAAVRRRYPQGEDNRPLSRSSLSRWEKDPALDFPKPIRIRNRKYFLPSELDDFDARQQRKRDAELDAEGESDDDVDPP